MLEIQDIRIILLRREIGSPDDELTVEFDESLDEGLMRARQDRKSLGVGEEDGSGDDEAFQRLRHPTVKDGFGGEAGGHRLGKGIERG